MPKKKQKLWTSTNDAWTDLTKTIALLSLPEAQEIEEVNLSHLPQAERQRSKVWAISEKSLILEYFFNRDGFEERGNNNYDKFEKAKGEARVLYGRVAERDITKTKKSVKKGNRFYKIQLPILEEIRRGTIAAEERTEAIRRQNEILEARIAEVERRRAASSAPVVTPTIENAGDLPSSPAMRNR
jgi:hypothetical protein